MPRIRTLSVPVHRTAFLRLLPVQRRVLVSASIVGSIAAIVLLAVASPAFAECPVPWYQTDANDLVQIKGTLYDNAGNATKISCKPANAFGMYAAFTGGFAVPPARGFQSVEFFCPGAGLDSELDTMTGANGADEQIVKNGVPTNACAFVGQRDDAGAGWPYGWYLSSVLKFDPVTGFKSEKGTLIYNLPTGSFQGKFSVIRK